MNILKRISRLMIRTGWRHAGTRYLSLFLPAHIPKASLGYAGLETHIGSYPQFRLGKPVKNEPHTVAWIERMRAGEVFYDIGASVGPFSLIAGKRGVRVYAFEPTASSFAFLLDNIQLNDLLGAICPLQAALHDRTGFFPFSYRSFAAGETLHGGLDGEEKGRGAHSRATHPLYAWRLDDLRREATLPFPDHLKIDIDGHELSALQGGQETLAHCKTAQVEVRANTESEVKQLFATLGFRVSAEIPRVKRGKAARGAPLVKDIQFSR